MKLKFPQALLASLLMRSIIAVPLIVLQSLIFPVYALPLTIPVLLYGSDAVLVLAFALADAWTYVQHSE